MSDKATSLRPPAASPAPALSPIVQLLPTGYRDIQPFQRGQGWHSNGKATAKIRQAKDVDRVVFPLVSTASVSGNGTTTLTGGPPSSVVDDRYGQQDESDDARERALAERRAMSPPVSAIPVPPPSRPHRPSSGSTQEGNQRASSSGSFRTRAIAASQQRTSHVDKEDDDAAMCEPDPASLEKLWQEYHERTKHPTKTIDKESYHRKMQRRYNETKVLRERIAKLEMELEDVRRERDEALETAQRSAQEVMQSTKWRDPEFDDSVVSLGAPSEGLTVAEDTPATTVSPRLSRSLASIVKRVSISQKHRQSSLLIVNPEEVSYREKAAKMERSIATAKEGIAQLQARLEAMHATDQQTIEILRAQLELEQRASKLLSAQVRETNAAFRSTADELVSTQVALEKERIEKQIVVEQIQAETRQLITDQRRKELQSRVKNVVRTLGKEALHQKMEALHTRVMTAEHHMRVAQLEVVRLTQERDFQQQKLDEILSCREIKYHCLASKDRGIPGILQRATTLYQGTRTINEQFLLVHMLYEDQRSPVETLQDTISNQEEPPSDPDDGFSIHILVYDAFTAQDDYLTFHLRDIRRLVPDALKFLARFADRKRQRYLELAEILFKQCHLGYKNGHIVLTERPFTQVETLQREKREVVIYRGSRFLCSKTAMTGECSRELLVDLTINEVHNPSTSQLWWLEIQGTTVDLDTSQEKTSHLTIDSVILKTIVPVFASYRPSESIETLPHSDQFDERNAFGIHEDLLEPLLDRLEWRRASTSEEGGLSLLDADGVNILSGEYTLEPDKGDVIETPELNDDDDSEAETVEPLQTSLLHAARVLDHRSIVSVGETFFCMRIEEVWDGELMLRITMEEPDDAMRRYQGVLHEKDIATIASYLYKSGLCDTDYSESIKFGLPPSLHDSLCRLLKKHVQHDLSPTTTTRTQGNSTIQRISLESLLDEVQPSKVSTSVQILSLKDALVVDRRRIVQVTIVNEDIKEQAASTLLEIAFSKDGKQTIHTQRLGCRYEESPAFVLVIAYSGFPTPFEDVVILDVSHFISDDTTIVISRRSLHETLRILGMRCVCFLLLE